MTAHPANPGVTVDLIDRDATAVQPLRTDIAGFVGVALRGPVGTEVPVESWRQFQSAFGGLHPDARLADAVKGFFDNGGRRAHVVRGAAAPSATVVDPSVAPDPTGASSLVVAADRFIPGAVANVTHTASPVSTTATITAVDPDHETLTWQTPLPPGITDLWVDRPVVVTGPDGVRTGSVEGIVQVSDHTSLRVRSVAGFRVGQVVHVLQTERIRTVARRIDDVLDGGRRLVWEQALPPDFAADPTLALTTGSTTAAAGYCNEAGDVLFQVAAASPGIWGDEVTVLARATTGATTSTPPGVDQPADRTATRVLDVSAFARGDLVRINQPGRPGNPAHAVVSLVDPVRRELVWRHVDPVQRTAWDAPLPKAVDQRQAMVLERVDLTIGVEVSGELRASFGRLSLVPEHARYAPPIVTAGPEALVTLTPVVVGPDTSADPAAALVAALRVQQLVGGGDGLTAISPLDLTGDALELVDEIAVLVTPDAHLRPGLLPIYAPAPPPPDPCDPCVVVEPSASVIPPPPVERAPAFDEEATALVQRAIVDQCERRRDRVAVLDAPVRSGDAQTQLGVVRAWRKRYDTAFAALYHPWVVTLDGEHQGAVRVVPPGGCMAGIYAQLDLTQGVHRAPANAELQWVHDLAMRIDDATHGLLNDEGIDALRAVPGRGLRPMGGRTMSSDAQWRYVNVRRLLCMIEKALRQQLQWAVFEPANWLTRELLRLGVSSLLAALWAAGALNGATADEAFYVVCDDTNNPPSAVADGLLVIDIGVAPVAPAEFVVLRIGRTQEEITVLDPVLAHSSGGGPS